MPVAALRSKKKTKSKKVPPPAGAFDKETSPQKAGGPLGPHYAGGPAVSLAAPVQTKVVLGRVGDPYEREANAVADRIVRGQPAPSIGRLIGRHARSRSSQ